MIINSPDEDNFKINLPLGYRFSPTHTELLVHYLKRKINNESLPPNTIHTVMLYEFSPDYLADMLGENEENELYVFSPRKIKSSKDARAERTTPDGHWKATSGDKSIIHNGQEVGYRKSLVYYKGKSTKAKKTKWIMEEYRLKDSTPALVNAENNNKVLHDFVLCKIHKHNRAYGSETRNGKILEEHLDSVATGVASEAEPRLLPGNHDINLFPDQNQYFSTQIHADHQQYSSPELPYTPESGQQNFSVHKGLDGQCSPPPYMPDHSPDESIESFFADWDDVKNKYSEMMGVEF